MKKFIYEKPKVNIVCFVEDDIITTSSGFAGPDVHLTPSGGFNGLDDSLYIGGGFSGKDDPLS